MSQMVLLITLFLAQVPQQAEAVPTAPVATFDHVVDKITGVLGNSYSSVKEEFKPLAKEVVRQFVAREIVKGVFALVGMILSIILSILCYRLAKHGFKLDETRDFSGNPFDVLGTIAVCVMAILSLVCFCMAASSFINAAAPYIAILELFNQPRCSH